MNKTLYVGFYDWGYCCRCSELVDGDFDCIKCYYSGSEDKNTLTYEDAQAIHKLVDWSTKTVNEEIKELPQWVLDNYTELVICEDGCYDYFKIKEFI